MSRNDRAASIGVALSVPSVFPNPDGTIGADDRYQATYCYPLAVAATFGLTADTRTLAMTADTRTLAMTADTRTASFALASRP